MKNQTILMKIFFALSLFCAFAFAEVADSAKVSVPTDSLKTDSLVVLQQDSLVAKTPDSLNVPVKVDSIAKSEVQEELAIRDSLLALGDSLRAAEEKVHQTELEVQNARCENWEKSYSTLQQEYNTCTKILRVNLTNGEAKQKEMQRMARIAQMGSWVGGIVIGLLVGIFVF